MITKDGTIFFQAKSFEEKESWIGSIGKAMIKSQNLFINLNYT